MFLLFQVVKMFVIGSSLALVSAPHLMDCWSFALYIIHQTKEQPKSCFPSLMSLCLSVCVCCPAIRWRCVQFCALVGLVSTSERRSERAAASLHRQSAALVSAVPRERERTTGRLQPHTRAQQPRERHGGEQRVAELLRVGSHTLQSVSVPAV